MSLCRIVTLGSGEGTNFQALITSLSDAAATFVAVISDQPKAPILARARRVSVPTKTLSYSDYPDRSGHDLALRKALEGLNPDLILLAGYMRILGPQVLESYEGKILNIHPSLLPRHPGLRTHQRALSSGDKMHGCTVHFVTADLDAGPAVIQATLPIKSGEDASSIGKRVQVLEHKIYPIAARWYIDGRLRMQDHTAWLDSRPLTRPIQYEAVECSVSVHTA